MIHYVKGDITESNCDIICHQVNCQGVMNSGVAKALREKWPVVYDNYIALYKEGADRLLGKAQAVEIDNIAKRYIVNLYSQKYYGYDGQRYTNYEAFYSAIEQLAKETAAAPDKSIAFPYKIGCVRGGANWNIIRTIIEEVLRDRDIYYYYLNDEDLDDRAKSYITVQEFLKETGDI